MPLPEGLCFDLGTISCFIDNFCCNRFCLSCPSRVRFEVSRNVCCYLASVRGAATFDNLRWCRGARCCPTSSTKSLWFSWRLARSRCRRICLILLPAVDFGGDHCVRIKKLSKRSHQKMSVMLKCFPHGFRTHHDRCIFVRVFTALLMCCPVSLNCAFAGRTSGLVETAHVHRPH